eukprot:CAMPEP_0170251726 /NCGR_PEP_ID=MMETSP0116_2-20130129/25693_1 /TAXON_ID=400756 /ORGANISM="Durinskia baltica, Strain CSIRO CS-38" /LENGTH=325 /DNA_ID=CAMNT_0010502689 /DNA_START=1 /DNA_END=976 /DNA_ORIENTATION=+
MIGLGAAFLVLLAAHRRPGRAVAVVTPEARGTGVRRAVAAASGEALARDAARGRRAGGRRQVTAATAGFQRPEVGDLAGAELVLSVGEAALLRREPAAAVVEPRAHPRLRRVRAAPEFLLEGLAALGVESRSSLPRLEAAGGRRAVAVAAAGNLSPRAACGRGGGGRRQVAVVAACGLQRPEIWHLPLAELMLPMGEAARVRRKLAAAVVEAGAHPRLRHVRAAPELLGPVRKLASVALVALRVETDAWVFLNDSARCIAGFGSLVVFTALSARLVRVQPGKGIGGGGTTPEATPGKNTAGARAADIALGADVGSCDPGGVARAA